MGSDLDPRSDIYSLGCLMYETLTGSPPFVGENSLRTMFMHVTEKPKPFAEVCPDLEIPKYLESIVFSCLERDPENRPKNAFAVLDYLATGGRHRINEGQAKQKAGTGKRWLVRFVPVLVAVTLLTATYLFLQQEVRLARNSIRSIVWRMRSKVKEASAEEIRQEQALLNRANELRKVGRTHEALGIFHDGMQFAENANGRMSVEYQVFCEGYADCSHELGNYDEAGRVYKETLKRWDRLNSDDERITHTQLSLARNYISQKNYAAADELFRENLRATEKIYGAQSAPLSDCLVYYGESCMQQHLYVKAEQLYRQALSISEKLPTGREHSIWLKTVVAYVIYCEGRYNDAIPLFEQAEAAIKTAEANEDLANALDVFAEFYRASGDKTKAGQYHARSLSIMRHLKSS